MSLLLRFIFIVAVFYLILSRFVFSVHDIQNAKHLFEADNAVSKQPKTKMMLTVSSQNIIMPMARKLKNFNYRHGKLCIPFSSML